MSLMTMSVPAMMMRGGTSRGMYFVKSDLEATGADLNELLPAVMGSPDRDQIDGLGGGSSTTSKVAIVSPSTTDGCDVDYLFAQVRTNAARVDWSPTCGNMLVGVGPFAIERGMVAPTHPSTTVRVNLVNTGARVDCVVSTPGGVVRYDGDIHIGGLSRPAAPIELHFREFVGGSTGALFPTGNRTDVVDGVEITALDAAVCAVIVRAEDLGVDGRESAAALNADELLLRRLEELRLKAAVRMGLGDVRGSVLPKVMLVAKSAAADITSRYFVPDTCHPAHAVSGAICLASAATLSGTVVDSLVPKTPGAEHSYGAQPFTVEHPSGELSLDIVSDGIRPVSAHIRRTARKLFDGFVFAEASRMAS